MLREIKKPVGDPEVLAAESREQYFKVFLHMVDSIKQHNFF